MVATAGAIVHNSNEAEELLGSARWADCFYILIFFQWQIHTTGAAKDNIVVIVILPAIVIVAAIVTAVPATCTL